MYIALILFPSDHVGPLCRAQAFTALPRLPTSSKELLSAPWPSNAPAACILQVIRSSTTPSKQHTRRERYKCYNISSGARHLFGSYMQLI